MSDDGAVKSRTPCKFKCLRCGLEYDGSYIPKVMEELHCPSCDSNSQRRLKEKKAE
jgi:Zn finger protein HypA/HybF involved in hydrogenase expression